eukprot:6173130-Pleurochrysis_carterae.AAC.1
MRSAEDDWRPSPYAGALKQDDAEGPRQIDAEEAAQARALAGLEADVVIVINEEVCADPQAERLFACVVGVCPQRSAQFFLSSSHSHYLTACCVYQTGTRIPTGSTS